MKKILVIDGNSIINRAFYGVRPLTTKSGKHTNAIFGMINIIMRQVNAIKPDYCAVAFDVKQKTFRHQMFTEYKAGRHGTPEELLSQFQDAKECLDLLGINVLELPGYEADDIQGTVAAMAKSASEETESYILSGDRDLLQLIDDKITVLLASNQDTFVMREAEFLEKYGVQPSQFVDMKALMGDSSDNIPGVAGVGEKTAANLIRSFGSLDGIYENIDAKEISKGVREKLIKDKENAYLSQKLARIITDAPLDKSLEDLKMRDADRRGLYAKFTELELVSFIQKFGLDKTDPEDTPKNGAEEAAFEFAAIDEAELISNRGKDFALQLIDDKLYLYNEDIKNRVYTGSLAALGDIFKGSKLYLYDAKTFLHRMSAQGCEIKDEERLCDLMLYAYLLNPGSGNSGIESLASIFLGKTVTKGAPCPELLPQLEEILYKKITDDGMLRVLDELELPLIRVLYEVEKTGFKIDCEGMKEYAEALLDLADGLKQRIYMEAGKEFNINSPKQLGEVLFVDLGLPCAKKTKSGYSTDAETLEELRSLSPIVDDILEYRQVTKLHGTYAEALPKVADKDQRIHTEFKQGLTATGRLSSQEPNLQNIPIKTRMGRQMRKYFIPKEGCTLVDADYSQIELRLLAHISDDYTMKTAFCENKDIHRMTAAAVFNIPEDEVTEEMRKKAKAVNFGIVYGISGFSLAKDIGTTTQKASSYIKSYLMNYPGIEEYLEKVVEDAKATGYTATPLGRRRYIPELSSQNGNLRAFGKRVAMNAPIQGAAADIMKLAMINVHKALKEKLPEAQIVMQVHDELVVECPDEWVDLCKTILKTEMESAIKLSVPLTVDVTSGKSWLDQE